MELWGSLISTARCANARVHGVLDSYAEKVTPKGRVGQAFFIFIVPLVVMGLVYAVCAWTGVESSEDCPASTLLHLAIPALQERPSECRELPLVADLPSVALGFTSTLAVTIYLTLIKRLGRLERGLVASGLVKSAKFREGQLAERLAALHEGIRIARRGRVVLLAFSIALSCYLYWAAFKGGRAFSDLSAISREHPSEEVLRASWWANHEEHIGLAVTWIVVGAFGIYFAAKQAYIYGKLVGFSVGSRKYWEFQYVPRDRDDDFGWKPVGEINAMIYLGFLNFAVSLFAVAYLLQDAPGGWGKAAIGAMALLGIVANLGVLLALLWVMVRNHRKIIMRNRAEVKRRLLEREGRLRASRELPAHAGGRSPQRRGGPIASKGPAVGEKEYSYLSVQGTLLFEAPRWYPLKGRLRPLLSVAPGLFAFYKAGAELVKLIQ
ncbi:hypothetical protein HTV45_27930 [Streptomyces sp. CHD11]|uniref:hypothetical protein n=1 Tax=Streptomyces sp. CHD11 TaxID=2741325 RepID=UPI001BFC282A|nr:hypothetical protein [Streptomyces sp. CHD11]MBT3154656.1 hypothetical protein [Streptomyces sp. CHD11]